MVRGDDQPAVRHCQCTGPTQTVSSYAAGRSVISLGGDLGAGSWGGGGSLSVSSFVVRGAQAKEKNLFAVGGSGLSWRF
jgi:hypothetical protein